VARHQTLHSASSMFALICLFAVLEVGKIPSRERAGQKPREQEAVVRVWEDPAPRPHLPQHPENSSAQETAVNSAPEQKVSLAKGWNLLFSPACLVEGWGCQAKLLFIDLFLQRFSFFPSSFCAHTSAAQALQS